MKKLGILQFVVLMCILIPQGHGDNSPWAVPACNCVFQNLAKYEKKFDTVKGFYCVKESCNKRCLASHFAPENTGALKLEVVAMGFCDEQKRICDQIATNQESEEPGLYVPPVFNE